MLFNLAIVLENQGLHDEAMEKYRDCLALHPGYFYARSNLARLLGLGQLLRCYVILSSLMRPQR